MTVQNYQEILHTHAQVCVCVQLYVNRELPDVQAGFSKGRRTRNQIANIHWGHKKKKKKNKENSGNSVLLSVLTKGITEKHLFLLY